MYVGQPKYFIHLLFETTLRCPRNNYHFSFLYLNAAGDCIVIPTLGTSRTSVLTSADPAARRAESTTVPCKAASASLRRSAAKRPPQASQREPLPLVQNSRGSSRHDRRCNAPHPTSTTPHYASPSPSYGTTHPAPGSVLSAANGTTITTVDCT